MGKNMEQSIADVIEKIFLQFGKEILLDGGKFIAILEDYAPNRGNERRVIRRMQQENLFPDVYKILNKEAPITRLELLLSSAGFSEDWKCVAFTAFNLQGHDNLVVNKQNIVKGNGKPKYFTKNQARNLYPNGGSEIVIPAKYTAIGSHIFEYLNFSPKTEKIILPDTITEIQKCAFSDITVESYIDIPDSVTIIDDYMPFKLGTYAYIKCSQNSYAYKYCRNNHIPTSPEETLKRPSTEKLTQEKAKMYTARPISTPNYSGNVLFITDVVSIEKGVFRNRTDFDILILGHNVKFIKQNAFRGCSRLRYVYFSNTVCSIGSNAFEGCINLRYLYFDSTSGILKEIFDEKEDIFSFSDNAFLNCGQLQIVVSAEDKIECYCIENHIQHICLNGENIDTILSETNNEFYNITVDIVYPLTLDSL